MHDEDGAERREQEKREVGEVEPAKYRLRCFRVKLSA